MKDAIYISGTLMIDLTKRCNLNCAHCFRGEPQKVDITRKQINALFNQIRGIQNLTLSGGEPMLAPDMICYTVDEIIRREIYVSHFGMVTNGTIQSKGIANAFNRMNAYINGLAERLNHPEMVNKCCGLAISNDEYHLQAGMTQEQINSTAAFYRKHCDKGIEIKARRYEEMRVVTSTGRATCFSDKPTCIITPPHRILVEEDERVIKPDTLTLTPTGIIFADGYITNDYEENPLTPPLCNIMTDSLWGAIQEWNLKHPSRQEDAEWERDTEFYTREQNRKYMQGRIEEKQKDMERDTNGLKAFMSALEQGEEFATAWKTHVIPLSRNAIHYAKPLAKHEEGYSVESYRTACQNTIDCLSEALEHAEGRYKDAKAICDYIEGVAERVQDQCRSFNSARIMQIIDKGIAILEDETFTEQEKEKKLDELELQVHYENAKNYVDTYGSITGLITLISDCMRRKT